MFDMSEWNRRAQARREQEQEADDRHHAEHVIPNVNRAFADPAFAMRLMHESARRRQGIANKRRNR